MNRFLLLLISLLLPVSGIAQGFGGFSSDQPFFAKDSSSGGIPTSSIYGWYDARQLVTNFSGVYPPSDLDKLGTWGAYRGTTAHLIATRGSGALNDPWFLSTGNNTNGPAIRNADFYTSFYRQFSRSEVAWSGNSNIAQPFTFFIVVKKTADNPNGQDPIFGSENNKTLLNIKINTAGKITMYAGSSLGGANGAISVGTWYLITAQFNGASSFIRKNGVQYVSGDAGSNPLVGFSIGMYDNFEYLIGNYSDTVFYNRVLTSDELNTVETELKTKNNL